MKLGELIAKARAFVTPGVVKDAIKGMDQTQLSEIQPLVSGAVERSGLVLIGDSRVQDWTLQLSNQFVDTYSVSTIYRAVSRHGKILVRACFAVGGKTLAQVVSEQIPQVLTMSPLPAAVYLEAGHNDLLFDGSYESLCSAWRDMYDALHGAGITIIQGTSPASNALTSAQLISLGRYTKFLSSMARLKAGFYIADVAAVVIDPVTGVLKPAYQRDGVHLSAAGANASGDYALLPVLERAVPGCTLLPDSADAGLCLIGNPFGVGSGGTHGAGISGTVPDLWDINRSGLAAATITPYERPDAISGGISVSFTAGSVAAGDGVEIEAGRPVFVGWSSGRAVSKNNRVIPTSKNGVGYIVDVAGSLSVGADPTGAWPTSIGTVFGSGSVTLRVVEDISSGTVVRGIAEILDGSIAADGHVYAALQYYDASYNNIKTVQIGVLAGATPSNDGGRGRVLISTPHAIPVGVFFVSLRVKAMAQAGDVVRVGRIAITLA